MSIVLTSSYIDTSDIGMYDGAIFEHSGEFIALPAAAARGYPKFPISPFRRTTHLPNFDMLSALTSRLRLPPIRPDKK